MRAGTLRWTVGSTQRRGSVLLLQSEETSRRRSENLLPAPERRWSWRKKKNKTAPRTSSWYLCYSWFASTKEKNMKIAQLSMFRRITNEWIYIYSHTMNLNLLLLFVSARVQMCVCVWMSVCVCADECVLDSWLNQNWFPSPVNPLTHPKTENLSSR